MSSPLLAVRQLSRSFGDRRAVDLVSFTVAAGQTLGLIGPNGAGKSTTVGMVCGLLRPDAGDIALNGQALAPGDHAARMQLGLVPQDLAIIDELSARENLRLFGALYGLRGAALAERTARVLDLVQLADRAGERPASFSGGMKRRLNIAAALLHAPRLLILDEPTVGVDPQSRNAIFDALEALKRDGIALIYTSHYMEEVERLADHIVIIDHGKVIADESPASLYRRLPAQAALHVDLADPASDALRVGLAALPGVARVDGTDAALTIALDSMDDALPVLHWLHGQGVRPLHYATAKAKLEDIFLTLTGRSLRD